jgi:multidrug efflux system outer membrane protein
MRLTLASLGCALTLAGCLVGPDYRRPEVPVPPALRFEVEDGGDIANVTWWTQLGDPVLDALIAEALANNKNVKIAAANVEQAAGVLLQTRAPLFPQLSYDGSAARQRLSERTATGVPPGASNPQSTFQVLGGATWELDLWGRVRRLTEAARANLLASEEARRGVILSLVASVANSYIQLRSLDDQLAIANRSLATYAESLRLFELQFQHGQIPQLNVAQARSQYNTAAAAIPPLEAQIVQTENAIAFLLGRNPGPVARGLPLAAIRLPLVPAALPSQLLERRPDILQAEQSLIAANAQIGAARALYFPTISLTGTLGAASADLTSLFQGPARVWSFGGSITGPIFTAGAISGQVQQARAAERAALLAYQAAIQSAFADVENALVARAKTPAQLAAQEQLVAALREYAYFARLQYDAGYTAYLTVLDAEQQLFPAELNLSTVRASVLAAYVNLYQAMGGGWVLQAETLTRP